MEAISDFPARALPWRPGSGVCWGSWPRPALAEAQPRVQSRPRMSVIRRMSAYVCVGPSHMGNFGSRQQRVPSGQSRPSCRGDTGYVR
jgi:hypothetical protein